MVLGMKLFIDSANVNEVKDAASWGVVSGVTTNPSLALKAGKPYKESVLEIAKLVSEGDEYSTIRELKAEAAVLQHVNDSFE